MTHPPAEKALTGVVTGSYETRGGERIWLVDWDRRQRPPPFDVTTNEDFRVGQRVRVVGGRLEADR